MKKSRIKPAVDTSPTFSEVVKTLADEERKREEFEIERLETLLPDMIGTVKLLKSDELLNLFDTCLTGCYSRPRKMQLMSQYKEALGNEINRRMTVNEKLVDASRKLYKAADNLAEYANSSMIDFHINAVRDILKEIGGE